ncbi:MAG: hypothetical protein KKC28_08125 [Verrucomicrobia bacterium]|nr:hypothetical protein [Verrucomicrobiota bacterium]
MDIKRITSIARRQRSEGRDQRSEVSVSAIALATAESQESESVVRRPAFAQRASPYAQSLRRDRPVGWPSSASGRSLTSDLWPLTSGFSLVEVTLALMVMAIGILSIMSLFPAGLDQNARSIADTHAAFFAEEVFGGLQATAETNWAGLDKDLPIATTNWDESVNPLTTFITPTVVTNIYCPKSKPDYEDHALRYRLVLTTNGLLKAATLFVLPGEFGSINDPSMFYAEFFRWKP